MTLACWSTSFPTPFPTFIAVCVSVSHELQALIAWFRLTAWIKRKFVSLLEIKKGLWVDWHKNHTRCCESNISQRHEKCQFYAFRDVTTSHDEAKYLTAPNATGKLFRVQSNPFWLLNWLSLAKWFLMLNWVGGSYRDSLSPLNASIPVLECFAQFAGEHALTSICENKNGSIGMTY